ncbi:MAG: ASPIC/UnbV domain-containing protein, partial [Anaerolineae bacterium]
AGSGYLSQDDTTLLFGLGEDSDPVTVRVRWPDGTTDEAATVPADQLLVLTYGG